MIKINLLPIRAARKREYVKQQLILFVVLIVGTLVGLYLWYSSMDGRISQERKDIAQIQQQIEQYKKAIGKVEEYKGLEAMLNRKLKIIEDLIKGKTGPVRVLDHLSQVIPKQVWLTRWEEQGGSVTMEGEALSNKDVAKFITELKKPLKDTSGASGATATGTAPAPGTQPQATTTKHMFTVIQLIETKLLAQERYGQQFVRFRISMRVTYAI